MFQLWCHAYPESEELPHPRGTPITLSPYLHIGNNTKTVFATIYARYSTFQGRNQVSRFIPCHLRTVRTACYTYQTIIIIHNHGLGALWTSSLVVGTGMLHIPATLSGSGLTPWCVRFSPKYVSSVTPNTHFFLFSLSPARLTVANALFSRASCSSLVQTTVSSM